MGNLGKVVFCTLLVVTLLAFPLGASDGIVLRIEWNNPFNPEASDAQDRYTEIYYKVTEQGATIRVYSINGELVRTLVENKTETEDTIVWDGKNDKGRIVGSGVYLVNLKIGKSSKTVKVVVLK
ncbi:MAG: T9SS type A sorting domain-containing protein [Elusimicrobia bacterium]|nr:MAG: T9SS type A sorting domain-containing protein [Elusimicrobiota bacterium]